MGKIYTHMGISEEKLRRKNSIILDDGNKVMYDVNYNKRLIVNMEFMGQENNQKSNVNSCGWKRDSRYYFKKLSSEHPEFFSQENKWAIEDGTSPVCDRVFIDFFPEYKDFLGNKLIHHIGEDGQAVALPAGLHTGYGIVHNIEKELGVTKNGHEFSYLVDNDYKDGKKFEWEDADQVMENVIRNSSANKTPDKQKDVREKGSESKPREKQTFKAKKYKVNVPRVVEPIGKGIWKAAKIIGPIVGTLIVTAMIEQPDKEYDKGYDVEYNEEYDEEYNSSADGTGNRPHASPREHNVKGHGQHYNTREGRIWKEKEPYPRGKKDKQD